MFFIQYEKDGHKALLKNAKFYSREQAEAVAENYRKANPDFVITVIQRRGYYSPAFLKFPIRRI